MIATERAQGLPISRLLPLVLCGLVLLAAIPVLTLGYLGARDNTSRLLRDRSELLLDAVEAKIRSLLEPAGHQLAFLAEALGTGRVEPEDTAALDRLMLGALAATPQVAALALVRANANVRRYTRAGYLVEERRWPEGYPAVREGLAEAGRARGVRYGQPVWSPILRQTLVPIRHAVRHEGGVLGSLTAVVTIADLSRQLAALGEQLEAVPFVLLGRDAVLAHPRVNLHDAALAGHAERPLPGLAEVSDAALAEICNDDPRPLTALAPMRRSAGHWTWLGGLTSRAYFYRELRDFGAEPWIVGFHVSSAASRRERWIVLAIGVVGLTLLSAACAAAVLIGRRLGRPVLALAAAAGRVEALDFAGVGRLERGPVREVNAAAAAFERMARGLAAFETYAPRALVRRLIASGEAIPPSEAREVTVMFTDLEGYTAFANGRPAQEVVAYLNEVLERVGPIIEASSGTIDKYTGDGLMAFWGAPEPSADHASRAARAALAVAAEMAQVNEARCWTGRPVCSLRIGLHTGPAVVGTIGFPGRLDYTVIGEAVNLAQRVQAAGRAQHAGVPSIVLVSEATRTALGQAEGLRFTPFDPISPLACAVWRLSGAERARP
jgi:class 3 adenylate cyclase